MTTPWPTDGSAPWPDEADYLNPDDNNNGYTPGALLGRDDGSDSMPKLFDAIGDVFDAVPDQVDAATTEKIAEHVSGASNPHPASAIQFAPSGHVTGTDVQAAVEDLDALKVQTDDFVDHLSNIVDAHSAVGITFAAAGDLNSDNVQSALEELDAEKSALDHTHTLDGLSDVDTSGAADGKILKHNGTSWVVGDDLRGDIGDPPANLGDLDDVDTTGASDGKGLVYDSGSWVPVDVATQTELDAHTADSTAAHAASAISFSATGGIAATDVQAAVAEVDSEAAKKAANLSDLASPSLSRGNLGLGTMATQGADAVAVTGGTIQGATITASTIASLTSDVAVADGGTGASTPAQARINLDVAQSTHTHTLDGLSDVVAPSPTTGQTITWNGTNWVNSNPGSGPATPQFPIIEWTIAGSVTAVATGTAVKRVRGAWTITRVDATASTTPGTGGITFDVNKATTVASLSAGTIWSTQSNRLTIASGQNSGTAATFNTTAVSDGDYFRLDVDAVPTGNAPANIVITVWGRAA